MNQIKVFEAENLLEYRKGYSADFVKRMIFEKKLNGMRVFAHLKEDNLDSLTFLNEFSFLKSLVISTRNEDDYGFLKYFNELKYLSIQNEGKILIDLSGLTNLERLSLQWRKNVIGLGNCINLKDLGLIDFNKDDLQELFGLKNLIKLRIKGSSLQSLNGIDKLINLEYLLLGNCKKLELIGSLNYLNKLKQLEFDTCPSIKDFTSLKINSLEHLSLDNCKNLRSLSFITNLTSLKRIVLGNTIVVDGDLRPLSNIKEKYFVRKSHYKY